MSPVNHTKISVYDKSDEAVFVLLDDVDRELTGKHASELVSNYFEGNGNKEDGLEVPVRQALLNTIGQTHKFNVKVTEHNLSGRTRVITVSKVLSPSAPPSIPEPVADPIIGSGNEILATGDDASEPSKISQACADVGLKRMVMVLRKAILNVPRMGTRSASHLCEDCIVQ